MKGKYAEEYWSLKKTGHQSLKSNEMQIRRSSYKVASDWLGRTMRNNAILKIRYGGRRDVGINFKRLFFLVQLLREF